MKAPQYSLTLGDCLKEMAKMDDASIDLIATDPPYFRVKDEPWDRQWDTREGFLSWLGCVADEWKRILKPNGSLYMFASPQTAWHVEGVIRERFNVLSNIRWQKPAYSTKAEMFDKDAMRSPFPASETIIFAEQMGSDAVADDLAGFTEAETALKRRIFGDYLGAELRRANVTNKRIAALFPSINGGTTGCVSNWLLGLNVPTKDQYESIRQYLNSLNCAEYLRQEYEELRQEYEELRRPFNATPDAPYTDVWTFPTVTTYPGKHPCEKPLQLMRHIISLSSRPDAVVLDCFLGSGTTGVAAIQEGRRFVGMETDPGYYDIACRRIGDAARAADGLPKQLSGRTTDYDKMPLFAEVTI